MMVIEAGDGSWQKRLDAGQCPKCRHKLESYTVLSGVRQGTQLLKCPLCKLEIIQKDPKEVTMLETKLMPSEEDFCATPKKMYWSDAVSIIEDVIEGWLNDPEPVDKDTEAEVREAWKRILQG
tara:strand:- start:1472 stop:1840 length:369 start_codon:yes stop_codon:yes gene_type:complete